MKNIFRFSIFCTAILLLMLLFCFKLPSNPADDPGNAFVELFREVEAFIVNSGAPRHVGLRIGYSRHFSSFHLTSSCSIIDTSFSIASANNYDTLWFNPVFTSVGLCSLFVAATYQNSDFRDKSDTLVFQVESSGEATPVRFTVIPPGYSTFVGRTDTLVLKTQGGNSDGMSFTFASQPQIDTSRLKILLPIAGDSVRVVFVPEAADSFAIKVKVVAGQLTDSAVIGVKVFKTPSVTVNGAPQTIVAGIVDTLLFTVDNNRSDLLAIGLVNRAALDPALIKVLSTGTDSLMVVVSPVVAGTATLLVEVGNGTISDTIPYIVTFVESGAALWNRASVSVSVTEGRAATLDLKPCLIRPVPAGVEFLSSHGAISSDTAIKWTPQWGCDGTDTIFVTGTKGGKDFVLKLPVTVTPGDTAAPLVRLTDSSYADKKVGSSQVTITAVVKDALSGMSKVTFTVGGKTIDAAVSDDSLYSATISGLAAGERTLVTITATDRSMKKNRASLQLFLTYDMTRPGVYLTAPVDKATGIDTLPTFTWSGGNAIIGDTVWYRVIYGTAMDNLVNQSMELRVKTCTLGEPNKLVPFTTYYWQVIARSSGYPDTIRSEVWSFTTKGKGVVITTHPASVTINEGDSLKLAVAATGTPPPDSYQWFLNTTAIAGAQSSAYTVAVSKPADSGSYHVVVGNGIGSETQSLTATVTIRLKPRIVAEPSPQSANEGGNAVFFVTAIGNAPLTYIWQKNRQTIENAVSAGSYTIAPATAAGNGDVYRCIVRNSIGADTSVEVLLTVTQTPVYTVLFESNGGTVVDSQRVKSGEFATEPNPPPTRDGYDFGGWFITTGLNTEFDFGGSPIIARRTLYAKWNLKTYMITYNLNNGSVVAGNPTTYTVATSTITLSASSRAGYVFDGWYQNSGFTGAAVTTINTDSTGNREFWAKWVPENYTITYNLNGGSNGAGNPATYTIFTATITFAAPTRSGYQFDGWYDNAGFSGTPVTAVAQGSMGNRVVWAKWLVKYVITYHLSGASKGNNPNEYTASSPAITLADPVRMSYVFAGWYTDQALSVEGNTIPSGSTGNREFWAKWIIQDVDGNIYTEVAIGTQVWLVENLLVTKYNDRTAIPFVPDSAAWASLLTPGYCWYGNNEAVNKIPYGALYNWYAVASGKLAPTGWHVPSDSEWTVLIDYLGGVSSAGGSMKETGSLRWSLPNTGATNSSGFTALPGGYRVYDRGYVVYWGKFENAYWWTSTEAFEGAGVAGDRNLGYDRTDVYNSGAHKRWGMSIRCVRNY